jgi:hypothetical protein
MLGWLGVALTGSDTASNVLFGSLQRITAERLGLSPVLAAAANSSGGVMGKMIDPQSIVVASTATRWYGHEGEILRYVFFHSLALACLMGLLVLAQAYLPPFTQLVGSETQKLRSEKSPAAAASRKRAPLCKRRSLRCAMGRRENIAVQSGTQMGPSQWPPPISQVKWLHLPARVLAARVPIVATAPAMNITTMSVMNLGRRMRTKPSNSPSLLPVIGIVILAVPHV